METFVIFKQPGQPAQLLKAPLHLDLAFLEKQLSGHVDTFAPGGHISDLLDELTIYVADGEPEAQPKNLQFKATVVAGPVLACLTDVDSGSDHGLCLEHAEAVAQALDQYGV